MALTKLEAAKLTNDLLLRGVVETIVRESSVLALLPFTEVTGTALTYVREATLPAASWYDVGDTWSEATPTYTQVTASLKILGGDADVDTFLQQTYADPNDLEALVLESRAKAVAHAFSDAFYNGDSAANPKQFDGLKKLVSAAQTIAPGANGGSLTLDLMDQLIDLVKPGRPDALLMSKRSRRKLSALRRASGNLLETDVDAFGRRALFYDGIPILVDDFISDSETLGSGTGLSSIYAVKFGPAGLMGLEHGGIQVERVGALETKDATRWRVKWYVGLALASDLGVARLQGITAN
ncbi:major capsid protein [Thermorudis peleae]|uniref:major capsid protein n=1 Tax=Thermorudis peleae TaxID=1382356 RepID=UPI00056F92BD|nr:phage major capsid protein [Thermorudis peleae]